MVQVTDPGNVQTIYEYDDFGRLLKVTSPDAGITQYSYDDAGNLVSEATDRLALTYNYLQRLEEVTRDSTTLADYTYDALVS